MQKNPTFHKHPTINPSLPLPLPLPPPPPPPPPHHSNSHLRVAFTISHSSILFRHDKPTKKTHTTTHACVSYVHAMHVHCGKI
jgi:hypothetical protein